MNGSPTSEFSTERALRQGDPLSAFLFIIAAETINVMMLEACEKGIFKAIKVGKDEVELSHLQFTDDALFLGEWSAGNVVNLMHLLKCFEDASGLRINLHKSRTFGVGVPVLEVEHVATILHCTADVTPFVYPGLLVSVNMRRVVNWDVVELKLAKKLYCMEGQDSLNRR